MKTKLANKSGTKKEIPPLPSNGAQPPEKTKVDLLCEAAGVDPKNVIWRIRPGFTVEQAIEVAVNEKLEQGG